MERIRQEYAWATKVPFWRWLYIYFAYLVGWSTVAYRTAALEQRFAERDAAVTAILSARVGEDVARIIMSMSIECTTYRYEKGIVHIIENHANGMVLHAHCHDFFGFGIELMEEMKVGYRPTDWNSATRYQKYYQLSDHYGDDPVNSPTGTISLPTSAFTMPTSAYCRWLNAFRETSKKHLPLDDHHLELLLKGR